MTKEWTKKIGQKITSFFAWKPNSLAGLDIGSTAIKVAQVVQQKRQSVLTAAGIASLPAGLIDEGRNGDWDQLAAVLHQLLQTSGVTEKNIVAAVSNRATVAREVVYPLMKAAELQETVKWDIEKYIPYAPGEFYYDFCLLNKDEQQGKMTVLLAAAPCELIKGLSELSKKAGLRLLAVDIEPLAICRIVQTKVQDNLFVDIGGALTQLIVASNGSPAMVRLVPIGGSHTSGHELAAELAKEIELTIALYRERKQSQTVSTLENVQLLGGAAGAYSLLECIQQYLPGLKISRFCPTASLALSPSLATDFWRKNAAQLAVAAGLVLPELTL